MRAHSWQEGRRKGGETLQGEVGRRGDSIWRGGSALDIEEEGRRTGVWGRQKAGRRSENTRWGDEERRREEGRRGDKPVRGEERRGSDVRGRQEDLALGPEERPDLLVQDPRADVYR